MLPSLATVEDATGYGYALPTESAGALLARASARLRRAALQPITQTTVTLALRPPWCGTLTLPAPPVVSLQAVTLVLPDGSPGPAVPGWAWDGAALTVPAGTGTVLVTYTRGYDPVPEGVVELCCAVADRLAQTPAGEGLIRQTSLDDYSVTYATEQIAAGGDLMPGELAALARALGTTGVRMVQAGG